MKIPNEVANVLAESRTVGELLYLPQGQLERNLYLAVNILKPTTILINLSANIRLRF